MKIFYLFFLSISLICLLSCASAKPPEIPTQTPIIAQQTFKPPTPVDITEAIVKAVDNAFQNVPQNSIIGIVHISTINKSLSDFIAGDLEHILVSKGYRLVDRLELDKVINEQHFQISGDVDENTAISVGKILGADVIIIGKVDGERELRRMRLRVLKTETAEVLGTASEPFETTINLNNTNRDIITTQKIQITSSPTNSFVHIFNQNGDIVYNGKTPATPNLNPRRLSSYRVIISHDGYQSVEINIKEVNGKLTPESIFTSLNKIVTTQNQQTTPKTPPPQVQTPPKPTQPTQQISTTFYIALNSQIYHKKDCETIQNSSNLTSIDLNDVTIEGFRPCRVCNPPRSSNNSTNLMVYKTNTGTKYHRRNCSNIKNKTKISLSNAKGQGLTACSVCNPPA